MKETYIEKRAEMLEALMVDREAIPSTPKTRHLYDFKDETTGYEVVKQIDLADKKPVGGRVIFGSKESETDLEGGHLDDYIFGGAGDDTIHAGDGNDYIEGNKDNDTLYGDAGNDTLVGGTGYDTYYSGTGNDTIIDSKGFDFYHLEEANTITDKGLEGELHLNNVQLGNFLYNNLFRWTTADGQFTAEKQDNNLFIRDKANKHNVTITDFFEQATFNQQTKQLEGLSLTLNTTQDNEEALWKITVPVNYTTYQKLAPTSFI